MPVKKSRGGCGNCKQKKIKCDEAKPSCQRCVRLNQQCLGYDQSLRWSDKHEVFRTKLKGNEQLKDMSRPLVDDTRRLFLTSHVSGPATRLVSDNEEILQVNEYVFDDFVTSTDDTLQPEDSMLFAEPVTFLPFDVHETASLADIELSSASKHDNSQYQDNSVLQPISHPVRKHPFNASQTQMPQHITHHDTLLVEYYFSSVATLYSCFDGNLNPFRAIIGKLFDSSLITKLTMQSMAAACLSRDFPHLSYEGESLRFQALAQIDKEVQSDSLSDISFMCLIMLGQSAGWHYADDLGIQQYNDARQVLSVGSTLDISGQSATFFLQAMEYWKMILSFVSESNTPNDDGNSAVESNLVFQAVPHPWALIVPEMMQTISEVGKLVLNHRKKFRHLGFWKQAQISELQQMIENGRLLEVKLLNHNLPAEAEIVDPGDKHTPRSHLIKIAEAYRHTALIQLYRVFPDILFERVQFTGYENIFSDTITLPALQERASTEEEAQAWLRRLVLHTIQILTSIPFESHTRSIQAFIYVALSSELRKSSNDIVTKEELQIIQARHLIQSRLEAYRYVFAPKPAQRKLDLVLKIWEQMDTFNKPAFWMDVMLDYNLEVVFC